MVSKRERALNYYLKVIEAGLMLEKDWARFRELWWAQPDTGEAMG